MKITSDYYYLLDNEKPIKIIWTKHEKSCVLKLGTEYPTAIVDNDRISGIPITEDELIKLGFEWKNFAMRLDLFAIRQEISGYVIYLSNESHNKKIELQSIHQLQNLYFALTNKELTYNE